MLLFMSFDYARLVLCSEAWFADRPEIILKDPISDTMTLSPGDAVGVAIVNADVHARVNDVLLGLGEARESARLLQSIRISRGHLKVEGIRAEEKPQHVSNRAGSGGMTRRVFREIGVLMSGCQSGSGSMSGSVSKLGAWPPRRIAVIGRQKL